MERRATELSVASVVHVLLEYAAH